MGNDVWPEPEPDQVQWLAAVSRAAQRARAYFTHQENHAALRRLPRAVLLAQSLNWQHLGAVPGMITTQRVCNPAQDVALGWQIKAANLRPLVDEAKSLMAFGRCDPSAALGTGLVKVPRDEIVRILGH